MSALVVQLESMTKFNLAAHLFGIFLGLACLASGYKLYCGGWRWFVVTSGSMQPALSPGSLIITQPAANYQPGDVITYKKAFTNHKRTYQQALITHRIIQVRLLPEKRYLTQGDANENQDHHWIKPEQIIGRAVFCFPLIGYCLAYANSTPGLILLVLLPCGLVLLGQIKLILASCAQGEG
ncbi:MAG: signal peptidase I [Candidatus Pacebacteria bacterium]|nr:signal peptidase I [Candidatus Paceibacterota bacterium]